MPGYTVYCDECDAGYEMFIEENEIHEAPVHCGYCGSHLKEENISSDSDEWEEDEWEKLVESDDVGDWESDDNSRN